MLSLLLAVCACSDKPQGDKKAYASVNQSQYSIQVASPLADGVQQDRAFSIALNFIEPGTLNPINVGSGETVTASIAFGPGTLSGTTALPGNDGSSLVFDNLVISQIGSYVVEFNGPHAKVPGLSITFNVGPRRNLRFMALPDDAIAYRAFTVGVEMYDPATGLAAAPGAPLQVSLSLVSGSGTLSGAQQGSIGGSSLKFTNLIYDTVGLVTLRASAYGCPDVDSQPFVVDALMMSFSTPPVSSPVNSSFSLSVDLKGLYTGKSIEPKPPVTGTLSLASGSGNLGGNMSADSVGSRIVFEGLSYNQPGSASFKVAATYTSPATSPTVNFGLSLRAVMQGDGVIAPGVTPSAVCFRLEDGSGKAWNTSATLNWAVLDDTGQQVQNGNVVLTGGVASVTPSAISVPGAYTVVGSVTSPIPEQTSLPLGVTGMQLYDAPGPFAALKSVRVLDPYSDRVGFDAPATTIGYGLLAGKLPPGLSLNANTGEISGSPNTPGSYRFTLYADLGAGMAQPIRCALSVFRSNESEIVPGRRFETAGPFSAVGPLTDSYSFTSSYDGVTYPQSGSFDCRLQYYYPDFSTGPAVAPVFVHHRGRGFNMVDYDNMGSYLASHGIIFVSVEDYESFYDGGGSGQSPNSSYDATAERGMESASAFQEGILKWLQQANAQSGGPLFGHVDTENVFVGGHSRGGGGTHATHVRSQPWTFQGNEEPALAVKGVVYFMAFDLRTFSSTANGNSSVYPVPTEQGRLPSLLIAAENDRDLFYPICDQFIDRASGPATFATIYGGCHNYMTDTVPNEADYSGQGIAPPYISRSEEQLRAFNLVVAFIKRWANLDTSLEGLLYNNELAGSDEVGVTAWRNMAERVVVDDYQGGSKQTNRLGGTNSLSSGTWTTGGSVYPSWGALSTLNVHHNILTLSAQADVVYSSEIPSANMNLSRTRRLIFRMGQIDQGSLKGFDWVTVRVCLTDTQGDSGTVTLFDRNNQYNQYLPDYTGGSNVYDRFVEANVPLARFTAGGSSLDLDQLQKVELIFETAAGISSRQVYLDDIRFE